MNIYGGLCILNWIFFKSYVQTLQMAASTSHKRFSDFLTSYELTRLQLSKIHDRSLKNRYRLQFTAFNRNFTAELWTVHNSVLTHVKLNVVKKEKKITQNFPKNLLYEGRLKDDKLSHLSGYVFQQKFIGEIRSKIFGVMYIEELSSSNTEDNMENVNNNVVIYRLQDMINQCPSCSYRVLQSPQVHYRRFYKRRNDNKEAKYTSCPIYVAADSMFYNHIGGKSVSKTVAKMAYHVTQADKIFRRTVFDGQSTSVGIVIASLTVYEDSQSHLKKDKDEYFKQWSRMNHGNYCLSILFTYSDFSGGVLGLAWQAEPNTIGGICEGWNKYYKMSFNTAMVTFLNYGKVINDRLGTLTVAHELGHAFGSKHDPEACQPGGNEGNYLMYEYSSDTAHPNNDKFSPCSIREMSRVLDVRSKHCFIDGDSYCGNGIIDENEVCDCGTVAQCHKRDPCCVARDTSRGIPGCSLQPFSQCSQSTGPCCSNECRFVNETEMKVCQKETECSYVSHCVDGSCPVPRFKLNKTLCNNGSNVCENGRCEGSRCSLLDLEQCLCKETKNLCQVCCNKTNGECVPIATLIGEIIWQAQNTSCGQDKYCDDDGNCLQPKHQSRLKVSFDDIINFLKKNWYIFIIVVVMAKIVKMAHSRWRHMNQRSQDREDENNELEMNAMS